MSIAYVDHIEVPVTDIARAKEFFGEVFGWKDLFADFGSDYVLVSTNDREFVSFGLYRVDKIPEKGTVVVLRVNSIEKSLELIERNGGKITRERFEVAPEIGFAAYFEDIFGNSWGLHTPPDN